MTIVTTVCPPLSITKCVCPPLSLVTVKCLPPKEQTNAGDEIVTYVHTNGCSVLYIYIDVGRENSISLLRATL